MARKEHDNYGTHLGLARWAVKHAMQMALLPQAPDKGNMLEPCCGDDAPFARAAAEFGMNPFGFDVRDVDPPVWRDYEGPGYCMPNHDIKEVKRQDLFDVIATNPPFIIGEQVVRRSLDMLAPHGVAVFLTKVAFLGTQERSKLFMERPPAQVWILRARPSFTGDGQTNIAQEYAFTFWNGHGTDDVLHSMGFRQTHLHWLNSGYIMGNKKKKRVRVAKEKTDGQKNKS